MDIVSYLLGKKSSGGGGGSSEYFTDTISAGINSKAGWTNTIKKLPRYTIDGDDMSYMFSNFNLFDTVDLNYLDTSNVKYMTYVFHNASWLETIKVKNWNTTNVTSMYSMFYLCTKLKEIDLSDWYTPNLTEVGNMFYNCYALEKIDMRNFTFDKVTFSYNNAFKGIPSACLIIVKDNTQKEWITSKFTALTNVKTVAELNE